MPQRIHRVGRFRSCGSKIVRVLLFFFLLVRIRAQRQALDQLRITLQFRHHHSMVGNRVIVFQRSQLFRT